MADRRESALPPPVGADTATTTPERSTIRTTSPQTAPELALVGPTPVASPQAYTPLEPSTTASGTPTHSNDPSHPSSSRKDSGSLNNTASQLSPTASSKYSTSNPASPSRRGLKKAASSKSLLSNASFHQEPKMVSNSSFNPATLLNLTLPETKEEEGPGMFWRLFVVPVQRPTDTVTQRVRKTMIVCSSILFSPLAFVSIVFLYFAVKDPSASTITYSVLSLLWSIYNLIAHLYVRSTQTASPTFFVFYTVIWMLGILLCGLTLQGRAFPIGMSLVLWVVCLIFTGCLSRRLAAVLIAVSIFAEWLLSFDQQFDWRIQTGFDGELSGSKFPGVQVMIRLVWTLTLTVVCGVAWSFIPDLEETEEQEKRLKGLAEIVGQETSVYNLEATRAALNEIRNDITKTGKQQEMTVLLHMVTQLEIVVDQLGAFKAYIPQSLLSMDEDSTPQGHASGPLHPGGGGLGFTVGGIGGYTFGLPDLEAGTDRALTEDELESVGTPRSATMSLPTAGAAGGHRYFPTLDPDGGVVTSFRPESDYSGGGGGGRFPSNVSVRSFGSGVSGVRSAPYTITTKRISVVCFNVSDFHTIVRRGIEVAAKMQQQMLYVIQQHVRDQRGIIDYFQGDHIWAAFNAVGNAATHAKKAAVATLTAIEELERDLAPVKMTAGLSTGVAAVGNMGIEDLKRYCMIGPVIAQASTLERLTKCYHGVSVLAPGAALQDIGFDVFYQAVDVLALPGSKPSIVASLETLKGEAAAQPNSEWMYQLEEEQRADPFAHVNAAFLAATDGDADAAQRCLDAKSSYTTRRSEIGERGARELIRHLKDGSPSFGTDMGLYYERIAPQGTKMEFNLPGSASNLLAAGGSGGGGNLPSIPSQTNSSKTLSASNSAPQLLGKPTPRTGSASSNRSAIEPTTRKMMEASAGNLRALLPGAVGDTPLKGAGSGSTSSASVLRSGGGGGGGDSNSSDVVPLMRAPVPGVGGGSTRHASPQPSIHSRHSISSNASGGALTIPSFTSTQQGAKPENENEAGAAFTLGLDNLHPVPGPRERSGSLSMSTNNGDINGEDNRSPILSDIETPRMSESGSSSHNY